VEGRFPSGDESFATGCGDLRKNDSESESFITGCSYPRDDDAERPPGASSPVQVLFVGPTSCGSAAAKDRQQEPPVVQPSLVGGSGGIRPG